MREAGLDISMKGIRIGGRCINNLRYADDTKLAATWRRETSTINKKRPKCKRKIWTVFECR